MLSLRVWLVRGLNAVLMLSLAVSTNFPGWGWAGVPAASAADWGGITIGQDGGGYLEVTLENSAIRVRYGHFFENFDQTAILDFVVKKTCGGGALNQDQVGSGASQYLDASSSRGVLTSAYYKYNGPDRKTVRLVWANSAGTNPTAYYQDISIFPDTPYIQINYLSYGVNIVEQGQPGGQATGTYFFYGGRDANGNGWIRDYVVYPESFYNRYSGDGINDPADGGALNFDGPGTGGSKDHFIGGVYGSNNVGFGRVMPISATNIIKLLSNRGFEWYAYFGQSHQGYTGYLFAISCGANDIDIIPPAGLPGVPDLSPTTWGQTIGRNANTPEYAVTAATVGQGWVTMSPDDDFIWLDPVTFTVQPAPGWSFTGWNYKDKNQTLSGSNNSPQVLVKGDGVFTATFALDARTLIVNTVGNGYVERSVTKPRYANGESVQLTALAGPGWTLSGWTGDLSGNVSPQSITMSTDRSVTATFTQNASVVLAPTNWQDGARRFRAPITVGPNGYARSERTAEILLNFTTLLTTLGTSGTFDPNSLRVVEVDAGGNVLDNRVDFQFDPDPDFNATTKAQGNLVILLKGDTAVDTTRRYQVYFATTPGGVASFTPPEFAPQVMITDVMAHAQEHSYKIQTQLATYYYHKTGAAFASLTDRNGADWISYHPLLDSAGAYRGFPNISDNISHPGGGGTTSQLVSQGPLKTVVTSTSLDSQWNIKWEFYPGYATMSLLSKPNVNYWLLYEGTPFGALDPGRDYFGLSNGVVSPVGSSLVVTWNADLPNEEWAYFGDTLTNRVLYVAKHEDDAINETFWQLSNNMTVFGYGRSGTSLTPNLSQAPVHLTVGFAEDVATVTDTIRSSYRGLSLTLGQAERLNYAPVLTSVGNKAVGVGQTLAFNVSASDQDGTTPGFPTPGGLPSGASFIDNGNGTGQFSWSPAAGAVGTHPVTFQTSDGSLTDSETIQIVVSGSPVTPGPSLNQRVYLPLITR